MLLQNTDRYQNDRRERLRSASVCGQQSAIVTVVNGGLPADNLIPYSSESCHKPLLQSASKLRLQCNHFPSILLSMIAKGVFVVATNLVVRNVEEDVALALKQLAASHGRSAEAEHREILKSVLQRPKRRSVAEVLSAMPNVGEDADFNFRNA